MEPSLTLEIPYSPIVLLVEDCLEDRETIKRYLLAEQKDKYTIFEASEAEEGLALYQRCQPDLVLLDYLLPDSDGLEFLEQIQNGESDERCPIILLTGQGNEKVAVQAMKAGVCDYLIKGQIAPEELRTAVRCAIENAQLRTQLRQAQAERDRQIEQEKLITQIANKIHSRSDIDEIWRATVSEIRQFLRCDRVFIYRFEPDWNGVVVAESVGDVWLPILKAQVEDTYFTQTRGEDYRLGRIQAIEDIYKANLTDCHAELLARFQIRANLAVPILQDDSLWGLLVANQCSMPRQWKIQDIELLKQLTTQVGIAIAQVELIEQERLLMRMQEQIRQSLNVDEILQASVSQVRQFLGSDRVLIFRLETNGNGIIVAEAVSSNATTILTTEIYDPCFVESYIESFRNGLVTAKTDIRDGSIDPCHVELLERFGVQANLVVPIKQGEHLWGLLIAHHCVAPRLWRFPEIELLKHLAGQVGIALLQGELYERVQIELNERKLSEMALRDSERRIASLAQLSPVGIWRADSYGINCCYANDRACEIAGRSHEEVLGTDWIDALHPDDRERVMQQWQQAIKENIPFYLEYRFLHADGTIRWVIGQASAETDDNGRIVGYIGTITDISALKQTEAALRESEARFRQIAETIEDVFWVSIPWERQILYLSPAYERIWGRTCESAYTNYQSWFESLHPDDRDRTFKMFASQIKEGNFDAEYRIIRSDGSIRWIHDRGFAIKDEAGNLQRVVGIAEDISDRKRAELALRESEERFQAFMNNSPFAAFIKDEAGYLTYANRCVEKIFNKSVGDLVGRSDYEILPFALAREMQEHDRTVFATGEATEFILCEQEDSRFIGR